MTTGRINQVSTSPTIKSERLIGGGFKEAQIESELSYNCRNSRMIVTTEPCLRLEGKDKECFTITVCHAKTYAWARMLCFSLLIPFPTDTNTISIASGIPIHFVSSLSN